MTYLYVTEPNLPGHLAPRPYLHPVHTRRGVEVTALRPADHPHHLGAGIAIAHVATPEAKHNFWGGSTYVRGEGPRLLDNHGRQRHLGWTSRDADGFTERLAWTGRDGTDLLHERRTLAVRPAGEDYLIDLSFALTNITGGPVELGSSATNGRPGAGYGGFFWRAPGSRPDVLPVPEERAHGSHAPWVALQTDAWTLAFAGGQGDPWFVRAAEFPGVGSALAWSRPVVLRPGGTLRRTITTLVADGRLSPEAIAAHLTERQ
ncbi:PmoA family protein [Actinocorallia longicatena]|uniref:PmoA family protein n=1 Tax=Actinocorallia longicatena TaxID=111803 RepID=A0ABP6QEW7_9ACTN